MMFSWLTINGRANHGRESPEESQEPEGAGKIVQAQEVHQDDGREADVGR